MKSRARQILWTTLVLSASAATVNGAIVRIAERAEVTAPVVRLGDVADVLDADPSVMNELKQITLAPAPAAGRQMVLDFATIRARLLAHGVNLTQIEFTGQSSVSVSAPAVASPTPVPVPAPVLRETTPRITDVQVRRAEQLLSGAIEEHVARTSPGLGGIRVTVQIEPTDAPAFLAAQGDRFQIVAPTLTTGGPQPVAIRLVDGAGELREIAVSVWIESLPQILAVKHGLPRGHVVQASDLTWTSADEPGVTVHRIEDVVGKETTRALRKDEPIRPQDVKPVPLVRPNDIVTVYVRLPGLTIRRQFKAQSAGALDETITVVALDTREKAQARVTGYHEAELIGTDAPQVSLIQDATGSIRFEPSRR